MEISGGGFWIRGREGVLWRVRALTNDIAGTGTAETSGKSARTLEERGKRSRWRRCFFRESLRRRPKSFATGGRGRDPYGASRPLVCLETSRGETGRLGPARDGGGGGGGRSTPPLGSSGLQPASLFSPARETDAPALFLVSLRALSLSLSSLSCAPEVDEGGGVRGEMPRID